MDGRYIVPVEPASAGGPVVVVEVHQNGTHPLDVHLVGCEGENPYVTSIQHRNIGRLKNKFKGTDAEWEAILSHFLLQKQPENAEILDNVRMLYAFKGDNIEVSIRQDVKGIKVTLGEIVLPKDDDFEFYPLEWAQASAQAHNQTLRQLAAFKLRASNEQDTIAKLNKQLEEFIEAKNETENAMLQQFMELLNEKKRKIRDQSRILASAKVDKNTASAVQSSREDTKPRKAGTSRTSKRKAVAKAPEPEVDPEPEQLSDADQMEIDQAKAEEQEEDSGPEAATPDRASDEETEDEDEAPANDPARSQPSVTQSVKDTSMEEAAPPPPRRELPFGRPATRSKPVKKPPPAADDGNDTEDEEL